MGFAADRFQVLEERQADLAVSLKLVIRLEGCARLGPAALALVLDQLGPAPLVNAASQVEVVRVQARVGPVWVA